MRLTSVVLPEPVPPMMAVTSPGRATNDTSQQANTLYNLGFVYRALGEKQKALEYYKEALPLFEAIKDTENADLVRREIGEISAPASPK